MNASTAPTAALTPIRCRPAPIPFDDGDGLAPVIQLPSRVRPASADPAGQRAGERHPDAAAEASGLLAYRGSADAGPAADPGHEAVAAVLLEPARAEVALVREMAKKICQASVEVLAGTRGIQQLSRWLDARSFDALLVRATLVRAAQQAADQQAAQHGNVSVLHHNPMVRSVHCHPVGPGVYECALVVAEHRRARAVAIRMEQSKGIWKATALQIG